MVRHQRKSAQTSARGLCDTRVPSVQRASSTSCLGEHGCPTKETNSTTTLKMKHCPCVSRIWSITGWRNVFVYLVGRVPNRSGGASALVFLFIFCRPFCEASKRSRICKPLAVRTAPSSVQCVLIADRGFTRAGSRGGAAIRHLLRLSGVEHTPQNARDLFC